MNSEQTDYKVKITRRVNLGFWKGCGIISIALLIAKLTTGSAVDLRIHFRFSRWFCLYGF